MINNKRTKQSKKTKQHDHDETLTELNDHKNISYRLPNERKQHGAYFNLMSPQMSVDFLQGFLLKRWCNHKKHIKINYWNI